MEGDHGLGCSWRREETQPEKESPVLRTAVGCFTGGLSDKRRGKRRCSSLRCYSLLETRSRTPSPCCCRRRLREPPVAGLTRWALLCEGRGWERALPDSCERQEFSTLGAVSGHRIQFWVRGWQGKRARRGREWGAVGGFTPAVREQSKVKVRTGVGGSSLTVLLASLLPQLCSPGRQDG